MRNAQTFRSCLFSDQHVQSLVSQGGKHQDDRVPSQSQVEAKCSQVKPSRSVASFRNHDIVLDTLATSRARDHCLLEDSSGRSRSPGSNFIERGSPRMKQDDSDRDNRHVPQQSQTNEDQRS